MLGQIVSNRSSFIIDNIISLQSGSEELTYELLADKISENNSHSNSIGYYIKAKEIYEKKGIQNKVAKISDKILKICKNLLNTHQWNIDINANPYSITPLIDGLVNIGQYSLLGEMAAKAVKKGALIKAEQIKEALGEKLEKEEQKEAIRKNILDGETLFTLFQNYSVGFKDSELSKLAKECLEKARERLCLDFVYKFDNLCLESIALQKGIVPRVSKGLIDSLYQNSKENHSFSRYMENLKEDDSCKYAYLSNLICNGIKQIVIKKDIPLAQEIYSSMNRAGDYYVALNNLFLKMESNSISDLYFLLNGKTTERFNNTRSLIENAFRLYKSIKDYDNLINLAPIIELTSPLEAKMLYTSLDDKESLKKFAYNALALEKSFSREPESNEDFQIYFAIPDYIADSFEYCNDKGGLMEIGKIEYSLGHLQRAFDLFDKAGKIPTELKLDELMQEKFEFGEVEDYMRLCEMQGYKVSKKEKKALFRNALKNKNYNELVNMIQNDLQNDNTNNRRFKGLRQQIKFIGNKAIKEGNLEAARFAFVSIEEYKPLLELIHLNIQKHNLDEAKFIIDTYFRNKDNSYKKEAKPLMIELGNIIFAKANGSDKGKYSIYDAGRNYCGANHKKGILKIADYYLSRGWYKQYFETIEKVNPNEEIIHELSKRLRDNIKRDLNEDFGKGIEFLVSLASSEHKDRLNLSINLENYDAGFNADQVSRLNFSSDLMNLNIVVKIEKINKKYETQINDIENEIYKRLKVKGIKFPIPIKTGIIEKYSINVTENIEGITISDILRNPKVEFQGKNYALNPSNLMKKAFDSTRELYLQLDNILEDIKIKKSCGRTITAKQYFLERQKEGDYHIEQFARNKFGDRFTDEVFIPPRTETENSQYQFVWCKDMNANNILYNPDSKDISFIDFNVVEQRIPEFDKIKFVDTPIAGNCFSRDKMVSMVGGKTQFFDRMSQYLNLRHMLGRYERNDIETARFFYERSGINNKTILI